jgi:hypothetical protein
MPNFEKMNYAPKKEEHPIEKKEEPKQLTSEQQKIEEGRLDLKDAQQEANEIREKAGVRVFSNRIYSPEKGSNLSKTEVEKIWEDGREPTAQDYDEALKVVEEMKRAAAEEPSSEKAQAKISRILEETKYIIKDSILSMNEPLSEMTNLKRPRALEHREIMNKLADAEKKLKDLRHYAKGFEKQTLDN